MLLEALAGDAVNVTTWCYPAGLPAVVGQPIELQDGAAEPKIEILGFGVELHSPLRYTS